MSGIEINDREPVELFQAETFKWIKSLVDYPFSEGWILKYYYSSPTAAFNITAVQSGTSDDYLATILSSDTSGKAAGDYEWQAWVEKAAEKDMVDSGTLELKTSLTSGDITDTRSHAKIVLDAIEAAIEGNASNVQEDVEIVGRKVKFISKDELLAFRSRYKAEYESEQAAEDIANGLGTGKRIAVRFSA